VLVTYRCEMPTCVHPDGVDGRSARGPNADQKARQERRRAAPQTREARQAPAAAVEHQPALFHRFCGELGRHIEAVAKQLCPA
jgi:hypothetical protein